MRISENVEKGVWQFRPSTDEEVKQLEEIARVIPISGELKYDGRSDDTSLANESDEWFVCVHLKYEVDGEEKTLKLIGTDIPDKYVVNGIRNVLYMGSSSKLVLVELGSDADGIVLTFANTTCKICGKHVGRRVECDWRVCDDCAEKCDHMYDVGLVLSEGASGLGAGNYCTKCGRGKPGQYIERDRGKIERITGIKIIEK